MNKAISLLAFLAVLPCAITQAITPDDNVVISRGEESYTFVVTDKGTVVKNTVTHEFEATRRAETVVSRIFYSDNITLDKASGKGKPEYRNASAEGIFHDDSRICIFSIPLDAKGKKTRTEFRRTFTDPVFFSKIPLSNHYPTLHKTITVSIPPELNRIKLTEFNLPDNITRSDNTLPDGNRIITYTITDLDASKDETARPSAMLSEPYVIVGGWFSDTAHLYEWEREISNVDPSVADIDNLISHITSAQTDSGRIADTFAWVQSNIRYVAYEEGDAGQRPDTPAEVLRKRYGDCKGMALLLSTLLRRQGFDAHPASIGTRDIPFDIKQIPSLAAENHMICVLNPRSENPLFLDATAQYIPYTHVPYSIQGKDALVHNGDSYLMLRVPESGAKSATDNLVYTYIISDGAMIGKATRTLAGDAKEHIMRLIHSLKQDRHQEALAALIIPHSRAGINTDSITFVSDCPELATISGTVRNEQGYTASGKNIYIDLNSVADLMSDRIDTYKRRHDYMLPYPAEIARHSMLIVPDGYDVTYLPDDFTIDTPQGTLTCKFTHHHGIVSMSKTMTIDNPRIAISNIDTWNTALAKWNEACNQQIELTEK